MENNEENNNINEKEIEFNTNNNNTKEKTEAKNFLTTKLEELENISEEEKKKNLIKYLMLL